MVVRIGHLLTQPGSIPAVPHRTGRLFFLGSWLVFLPLRSLAKKEGVKKEGGPKKRGSQKRRRAGLSFRQNRRKGHP